jgi:ubiquitin-activating enzyme E1-like protein 2
VCSQTEQTVFTDGFFKRQDFCVNALDNVDARRYMDTRCVSTQKPLLESGTLAAKGHVQVIVPHLTESYNSQKDPNDADAEIPYCTLKSFPANIDHCIQWSRDKFESLFKIKPLSLAKFFEEFETREKLDALIVAVVAEQPGVEKHYKLIKYLSTNFCFTWSDCLVLARAKFEKYFTNKAKDLLNAYPLDHLMNDGSLFWKLPKRPPMPVKFDYENRVHLEFVASLARLFAVLFNVARDNANDFELIKNVLRDNESRVPSWKPRKKHIEVDETKKKEDVQQDDQATDTDNKEVTAAEYGEKLQTFLNRYLTASGFKVDSIDFEKDDDTNGHIDFISAASNLRAAMYSIEQSDKMMVKRIAGKIVPAIATTTSSIAGFVSVELVKLVQSEVGSAQLETFRNVFLNLGISLFLLSEPGPCAKVKVTKDLYVTLWDRWVVNGNENFMLKNFIDEIKQKFRLTVSG